MKRLILVLVALVISISSFSQVNKNEQASEHNGFFYTEFESGIHEKIKVKFKIEPKLAGLSDETLRYCTREADVLTKYGLKYPVSYTPISEATGSIYLDGNNIIVAFPYKGQNGYGNIILLQQYHTVEGISISRGTSEK